MGGNFHLKLNMDSRPIANKYREGKVKRTLERELKVPEIAEKEANGTSFLARLLCAKWKAAAVTARVQLVLDRQVLVFLALCVNVSWVFEEIACDSEFCCGGSRCCLVDLTSTEDCVWCAPCA